MTPGIRCILLMLLLGMASSASLAEDDPFGDRLDEESYLEELGRLQLTPVLDYYLQTRLAGDPTRAAEMQIDAIGAALQAPGTTSQRRRSLLEDRLRVRRDVLESGSIEERSDLATWHGDQAEDLLVPGLGFDRLGLVVILGRPSEEERQRARRYVKEAREALVSAEIALEGAIRELEKTTSSRRNARQRELLLYLRETERDRRLPLLRGMALVHAGMMADDEESRLQAMTEASEAMEGLHEQLEGQAAVRAGWLSGLALAHLGRFDEAEEMFRFAATSEMATQDDILVSRLGGVINRTRNDGSERGIRAAESLVRRYEGPDAVAQRVLLADHIARLHLAATAAGDREYHEAAAARAYIELGSSLREAGYGDDVAEAIVSERLVGLPVTDVTAGHLPPELGLARVRISGSQEDVRLLLEREDLSPRQRALASLELATLLERDDRLAAAVEICMDTARTSQELAEGGRAIDQAARLSMSLLARDEDDPATRQRAVVVLDLLLDAYPERRGIDGWRLSAARLALQDARLDDAREAYGSITRSAGEWTDAAIELSEVERRIAIAKGTSLGWDEALARQGALREAVAGSAPDSIRLVMAATCLDAGRLEEAGVLLEALDPDTLDSTRQATFDALTLRAAEGSASSLVRAANQVAQRGSADGGVALQSALRTVLQRVDAEAMKTGITPPSSELERDVLPMVEALQQWLLEHAEAGVGAWSLVADGLRLCGQAEAAMEIYDRLLASHPNAGSLLLGRAECLFALGGEPRLVEAMGIYRRLASAGMESDPRRWWLCQLRMLEILDVTGRNTDQVAPRIRRLREQDPALGGADTKRGFEGLLARHQ